ncbi:MAG6450 family protein [Pontibacter sp. G13]|uniref:MAG6450 family protein n=1 Tax=Pontibacter sp. G13 TaxID=3074898 RepID=UPI0039062368
MTGNQANVFVSLRYVQDEYECFSDWEKVEMKNFWNFLRKVHDYTWQQVYNQAGKRNKSGLAYTPLDRGLFKFSSFLENLSEDVQIFELRVSGKIRVHGFRVKSVFYICWLDREHRITGN